MAKIVVGFDGSEPSRHALRWAVEEARLRGAELVALHAYQVPAAPLGIEPVPIAPLGIEPVPALDLAGLATEQRAAAQELVEQAAREAAGGGDVTVTPLVVEGAAAEALVEAAQGADLLVVGSRGHGGFAGLLLGSVGAQSAQHAACPVVIVR